MLSDQPNQAQTRLLREESMTTIKAIPLASLVTAINVPVAIGFSIAAIAQQEPSASRCLEAGVAKSGGPGVQPE
jgi:hypothetical protein